MTILITGGSGFIGSHLVDEMVRHESVINIDREHPKEGTHRHKFYLRDIASVHFKSTMLPPIDKIYHLAGVPWAKVGTGRWILNQKDLMESNIIGTQRLLNKVKSNLFVFSSTANLYGNGLDFKEDSPFDITSPYGYSKAVSERAIEMSGKRYVIFRFGTVVGTRGRCFPNLLVWSMINGESIELFNNGDTFRDIIDVREIVNALSVADQLENGIYNLSAGSKVRGPELAKFIDDVGQSRGHKPLDWKSTSFSAPGYMPYSTLNIDKILATGVWKPRIPLRRTIEWLFDYYEGKLPIKPPRWDEI